MISSRSSLAQTVPTNLDLNNPQIKKQIANTFTDLKVCQQDKLTLLDAYNDCANDTHGELQFWQTPTFVIGGFLVTISTTTAVICLTHFMGACK
jgi:hypothetical protein